MVWSTNPLERMNKEIKRLTKVVGIFPNDPAIVRVVGRQVLEQQENGSWSGDFQERSHSLAAIQADWIKDSARSGSGSSVGLFIHTSSGWSQQRVLRLQRVGLALRAVS